MERWNGMEWWNGIVERWNNGIVGQVENTESGNGNGNGNSEKDRQI